MLKKAGALAKFDKKSPDYNKFAGMEEAVRFSMRAGATRDLKEATRSLLDCSIKEVPGPHYRCSSSWDPQAAAGVGRVEKQVYVQTGQAVAGKAEAICVLDAEVLQLQVSHDLAHSLPHLQPRMEVARCSDTWQKPSVAGEVQRLRSALDTLELSDLIYIALLYLS